MGKSKTKKQTHKKGKKHQLKHFTNKIRSHFSKHRRTHKRTRGKADVKKKTEGVPQCTIPPGAQEYPNGANKGVFQTSESVGFTESRV